MYFANPWGLLGLVLLPTIVFIHLYQRRFPPLEIGGLHLWGTEEQTKTAGRRIDRLPITKTLLLELVAALLLSLLLARPQLSNLGTTVHWVFVLDNSASMMAQEGSGVSFREGAMAELRSRVSSTGRNSRVSIILTGRRPTMLAGPAVRWSEADPRLSAWAPEDTQHDFQPAWDMAAQLTENSGKRVFITDDLQGVHDRIPPSFELVSVGNSLPNLAFETARWSIDADSVQENLYLRVRNYSDQNVQAEIVGRQQGIERFRTPIDIEPKSSKALTRNVPGGLGRMTVTIEQTKHDRLPTDSAIELIEPKLRTVHIAVSLPEDFPGRDQLVRVLRSIRGIQISDLADADFVVMPANTDAELPNDSWSLEIGPMDPSESARKSAAVTTGPFLIERRNELLAGLNLQGIIWGGIQTTDLDLAPMISVDTKILLGQRSGQSSPAFLMNIDLAQTNLADSPDWPILMSNFVEACRDSRAGLRRWNYRVNEIIRFDLESDQLDSAGSDPLTMKSESGSRRLVRARTVEIPPLASTGVYEVFDGDARIAEFAVNFFDRQESDLSGLSAGTIAESVETEQAMELAETAPWVWMLLISGTMVVAMINWAGLRSKPSAEDGS